MKHNSGNLLACVANTIHRHALIEPRERVLVAVSGGADSVCLLRVLHALSYRVAVAHFDHQTRSGSSAEDAAFVKELADRINAPYYATSRPIQKEALASGMSFEEYAREQRYAFFFEVAKTAECHAIATGHHQNDQAETILMRLLRGTSPQGLAGIPYSRTDKEGLRIIRPLLDCPREEIRAYLAETREDFREDGSNADPQFLRNRIRHGLLPYIAHKGFNPSVNEALARLADLQRDENALLCSLTEEALRKVLINADTLSRANFRSFHVAIQRRILMELARRHGAEMTFERVMAGVRLICEGNTGEQCDLGSGLMLANGRNMAYFMDSQAAEPSPMLSVALAVPGITHVANSAFQVRILDHAPNCSLSEYCTPSRQVFDADQLKPPLMVRGRHDGDRFTPFGMAGSKKIQDYFVDIGIPGALRNQKKLVTDGERIIWVVGHAIDAHAAVSSKTQRWLQIEVHDETK